jgi:protein-serine/threonine kinase
MSWIAIVTTDVLVNIPRGELLTMANPIAYPKPIITLTDLGLSRRIDPDNPLLTTRCGSEDYVPPELLMGQPYDGRQTDSWALGVLLYAVIENRLPFDPPHGVTGARARGRTAHRIARVEWSWIKLKGDVAYDSQWDGAKEIVEGCLQKRNKRLLATQIVELPWVSGAMAELRYGDFGSPVDNLFA